MTVQGPALMMVTGMTLPASSNCWLMPIFLPIRSLDHGHSPVAEGLDLDVDAGRQVQLLQLLDRLVVVFADVDQPLVDPHFEVLARLLVDVRGTEDAERWMRVGRGMGPETLAPVRFAFTTMSLTDWSSRRWSKDCKRILIFSIVRSSVLRNALPGPAARRTLGVPRGYSMISVTVPAPTVRPPSRMAKRRAFSMATSVISSISRLTESPGMTISTPAGSLTDPVTSVVRK